VKEKEKISSEELKAVNVITDNAIAAASDVTLTSDVADEQLPVEPKAVKVDAKKPLAVSDQTTAGEFSPSTDSTWDGNEGSSGTQEPSSEVKTETALYIDCTGTCGLRQPSEGEPRKGLDDKAEEKKVNEEQKALKDQKEVSEELQETDEEHTEVEITESDSQNLETSAKETSEAVEEADEDKQQSEEKEAGVQSTEDEEQLVESTGDVEVELKGIEVPDSEDDERDSTSVFSTCDEWLESPTSGKMMENLSRSLPVLDEDTADSVAGLEEPDKADPPPKAPRSRGPRDEMLPKRALSAGQAYSHGDIPNLGGNRKLPKPSKVCFRYVRGSDRNAGDRSACFRSAGTGSTQLTKPSKHRSQSPPLGGRIPRQSGRAAQTSKGASRPTAVPTAVWRSSTRSSENTSTSYTFTLHVRHPRSLPQTHENPKTIKPIIKRGKPAWK